MGRKVKVGMTLEQVRVAWNDESYGEIGIIYSYTGTSGSPLVFHNYLVKYFPAEWLGIRSPLYTHLVVLKNDIVVTVWGPLEVEEQLKALDLEGSEILHIHIQTDPDVPN
jgi:hypothetical protein